MKKNTIKLDTLTPNPRNPRKISEASMEKLCASITRDPQFMLLRPIVVDENRMILGGNQRFFACQRLGMTEIPETWVWVADNLTDEQKKRFVLVDNSPDGMSGYWDYEVLQDDYEIEGLTDLGFSFPETVIAAEEWQGMPQYENNPQACRSLIVHFETPQDVEEFSRVVNQPIGAKQKSLWFPEKLKEDLMGKAFVSEGAPDDAE